MPYTSSTFFSTAIAALDRIDVRANQLFDTHNAAALNRTPRPGSWSAIQCFEHLVKINRLYLTSLDRALQHAHTPPISTTATFSHTLFERYFIWTLEPPARMKLPAPRVVAASDGWVEVDLVRANYFASHKAFRDMLERIRQVDIKRTRVTSPIAAWLSWSIAATVDVMLAHERRHLWQAERTAP